MTEWGVSYWSVDYDRVVLDYYREKWLDHPDSAYSAQDVVDDTPGLSAIRERGQPDPESDEFFPDVLADVKHTITRLERIGLIKQATENPHYRYVPAAIFLPEISASPWD